MQLPIPSPAKQAAQAVPALPTQTAAQAATAPAQAIFLKVEQSCDSTKAAMAASPIRAGRRSKFVSLGSFILVFPKKIGL
jgi:hypothetical protein